MGSASLVGEDEDQTKPGQLGESIFAGSDQQGEEGRGAAAAVARSASLPNQLAKIQPLNSGNQQRAYQHYFSAQLDQDFCSAICILLGNFVDLLGNFKFQTII